MVKATHCLLEFDPESLFAIANLTLFCLYCEMLKNHVNNYSCHSLSHLISRLTDDPWNEASLDDLFNFILFLFIYFFVFCFHGYLPIFIFLYSWYIFLVCISMYIISWWCWGWFVSMHQANLVSFFLVECHHFYSVLHESL